MGWRHIERRTCLDLGWDDGTSGVYVNYAFQYYEGTNVASNTAEKGGGGFYTRLFQDGNTTLTAGVNTTLMHYNKNLSYFTYGQGGYFSPQQYMILNLPVEYMGRNGRSPMTSRVRSACSTTGRMLRIISRPPATSSREVPGPPAAFIPAAARQASRIRSAQRANINLHRNLQSGRQRLLAMRISIANIWPPCTCGTASRNKPAHCPSRRRR
jgi:hypothetical protein